MSDVLRCYSKAEWVEEDWERCTVCRGTGDVQEHDGMDRCLRCGGHGSLKAAALAAIWEKRWPYRNARCEGCAHLMSEGTFNPPRDTGYAMPSAETCLRNGEEPKSLAVHFSRCDEHCEHRGPAFLSKGHVPVTPVTLSVGALKTTQRGLIEASWRCVEVRRLFRPGDLRPEHLRLLCLRCWVKAAT